MANNHTAIADVLETQWKSLISNRLSAYTTFGVFVFNQFVMAFFAPTLAFPNSLLRNMLNLKCVKYVMHAFVGCLNIFRGMRCLNSSDLCKRGWDGIECDKCYPGYTGENCDKCDVGWIEEFDEQGILCDKCEPEEWVDPIALVNLLIRLKNRK